MKFKIVSNGAFQKKARAIETSFAGKQFGVALKVPRGVKKWIIWQEFGTGTRGDAAYASKRGAHVSKKFFSIPSGSKKRYMSFPAQGKFGQVYTGFPHPKKPGYIIRYRIEYHPGIPPQKIFMRSMVAIHDIMRFSIKKGLREGDYKYNNAHLIFSEYAAPGAMRILLSTMGRTLVQLRPDGRLKGKSPVAVFQDSMKWENVTN